MEDSIKIPYAGKINRINGINPRNLYEHQIDAMEQLNKIDKKENFKTLLVLPTGGGKTMTAAYWLLKEAINKQKKILWIAHRHLLLEQAADTFKHNAYSSLLYNISSFNYRIVSGKHDQAINIKPSDNILIMSKDSAIRNLSFLDKWLSTEEELYLVIDEAHHATAKSYRKLITHVEANVKNTKLLGLTATPFRTADNEQGLLAKIFKDGITYKIDLKDLINKGILSRPYFEDCLTDISLGENLGLNALKSIEQLDSIPDDIADEIASNKERNNIIVNTYLNNKKRFGQTIVFAVNRIHAFALKALFEKNDVSAEVIVSGTKAEFIGIDLSNKENEIHIEDYRNGKIQVLINVNILTEGVDLPKTKTVFLARPTVSRILMTQMVGRALRGENAGGTKEAYVVTFIDNWEEKIAWANPEELIPDGEFPPDHPGNYTKPEVRLISIAKIEEFARIIDETVDTSLLESLEFMKRVPIGMYVFSFIDDNKMERNAQILVYDSTKLQYKQFVKELPLLFEEYNIEDEILEDSLLDQLTSVIEATYFDEFMLPSYDEKDIKNLIKYYAQKSCEPNFIPFSEIDRKQLDLKVIAQNIVDKDMRRSEMNSYIDELWNSEDEIIRIFFNRKIYFNKQLLIEIDKIEGDFEPHTQGTNFTPEDRPLNKLSLYELSKANPDKAREIKDKIYSKYENRNGKYYCKHCGYESSLRAKFQIDHIIPISKGGLTEVSNLQLLCSTCNGTLGNKDE